MNAKPTALNRAELDNFPLPSPKAEDKNDKGRILVVAGSAEVPGAALLCSIAAMRAGSGKLQIATDIHAAQALGVSIPEARILGFDQGRDGGLAATAVEGICELAEQADAVVAGPGIAPGKVNKKLVQGLCSTGTPLILDAELLRVLSGCRRDIARADSPILLPHAGEMAELLDVAERQVQEDPLAAGRECSRRYDAVTLVKGRQSHAVAPDGRAWLYTGGSPGLAVSGSGDVLAGIVGGLKARGAEALTALLWGVWLHGEAGARLGKPVGHVGFLARELPGEIPALLAS
ncbi:NAD(P)H-hydrate dehydratase [Sphingomonas alba]|uniref:ADP-dependent (S)-NAD(P)H-hydrate dehydratase n=1 Tax=Sphingomonas alba TaxID=2908208 RepID=A0ABT0RQB3_9SPHN|nr:NAD(P)H-hydrate dehydratase [Sphingomonas alba]MCL6684740.1 NAD(P)H-hydrate dehydratase [Sphingomonas alba]